MSICQKLIERSCLFIRLGFYQLCILVSVKVLTTPRIASAKRSTKFGCRSNIRDRSKKTREHWSTIIRARSKAVLISSFLAALSRVRILLWIADESARFLPHLFGKQLIIVSVIWSVCVLCKHFILIPRTLVQNPKPQLVHHYQSRNLPDSIMATCTFILWVYHITLMWHRSRCPIHHLISISCPGVLQSAIIGLIQRSPRLEWGIGMQILIHQFLIHMRIHSL